ncbi:uncharacterized protein LOC119496418 [Sebastes umbrosus]|uniref:uncharacterized protein LOC119496418 n=1 Tax=Sebastes umbrosus TaxID=72105 RepID=UPI00189E73CF|nr:uncharacterized protein LOC119496418 [Sebastes umbrosus]
MSFCSMKDTHQDLIRTRVHITRPGPSELLHPSIRAASSLHQSCFIPPSELLHPSIRAASSLRQSCFIPPSEDTMHCGYPFILSLVLWAELAAGMVLPTSNMQSTAQSLEAALQSYISNLKKTTYLQDLPDEPCADTVANESSTAATKLSHYQQCADNLKTLCTDDVALCNVITLQNDLLQHLRSTYQDPVVCPKSSSSSSSSPLSDFNSITRSIQCVDCWSRQVAALC